MKQELEFLKQRAAKFYKYANKALDAGDYDLAAFHLEQSAQLYLKYTLGLLLGDFPKLHNLRVLIEAVSKASKNKNLLNLLKEEENVIADLEDAYITSRYIPALFTKNQLEGMKNFVVELKELLEKIWI